MIWSTGQGVRAGAERDPARETARVEIVAGNGAVKARRKTAERRREQKL